MNASASPVRCAVAVVGAGLVGASLAWGLRALGPRLAVVDAGDCHAASRGTFGLVWVQGKGAGSPAYVDWTLRSARRWPELAQALRAETGIDVALDQPGGLHVALSRGEVAARAALLERLSAQAAVERCDVHMLTRAQALERVPLLGPDVAGASYCPLDGHCNPLRLLRALHAALDGHDVLRRAAHVDAIVPTGRGFELHAGGSVIEAERIVVAAGRGTPRLAAMIGVTLPLVADVGEVLVLERMRPFLTLPLETIRQTDEGTVLVGDSHEARDDAALDLDVLGAIARRALRVLPALAGSRVVRAWAAARVMTPDGLPVYAQSAAHPGAFVAAVHSGVTLAAAHALDLAPALAAGALPPGLAAFAATRFENVRAAA